MPGHCIRWAGIPPSQQALSDVAAETPLSWYPIQCAKNHPLGVKKENQVKTVITYETQIVHVYVAFCPPCWKEGRSPPCKAQPIRHSRANLSACTGASVSPLPPCWRLPLCAHTDAIIPMTIMLCGPMATQGWCSILSSWAQLCYHALLHTQKPLPPVAENRHFPNYA